MTKYITLVRPTVFSHLIVIARRDHLVYGGTVGIDILEIFKGTRAKSKAAKESNQRLLFTTFERLQSSTMAQRRRRRRSGRGSGEKERRTKERMER